MWRLLNHLSSLLLLCLDVFQRIFFLRHDSLHVAKLLLKRMQHLLRDLELHSPWMVLDRQCILTEILYQHLVLCVIVVLAHLQNHVLVRFYLFMPRTLFTILFVATVRGGCRF